MCVTVGQEEGAWGHEVMAAPGLAQRFPQAVERASWGACPRPPPLLRDGHLPFSISRLICERVTVTVSIAWSHFQNMGARVKREHFLG